MVEPQTEKPGKIGVIFFGSFQHHSTKIAQALLEDSSIDLLAIVTTPARVAGRKKQLTKTHTHQWALDHHTPVHAPEELDDVQLNKLTNSLPKKPDIILTAGYGKLLPPSWLALPAIMPLNLHFSLLPKYRGANPAEWAILLGEDTTGVTLIEMNQEFDQGNIIAQSHVPIEPTDTRETVYQNLYDIGSQTVITMIKGYLEVKTLHPDKAGYPQEESPTPPATRFTRAHGFIDWRALQAAQQTQPIKPSWLSTHLRHAFNHLQLTQADPEQHAQFIHRCIRALAGFPGAWTYVVTKKGKQRLKILSTTINNNQLSLNQVQLEGKTPTSFNQIKDQLT